MALGDVIQVAGIRPRYEVVTLKTGTTVTKGYIGCYDTDGYAHATLALKSTNITWPLVVFMETATQSASVPTAKVLRYGVVEVLALGTVVISKGQLCSISTTLGAAGKWSGFTTHAGVWAAASQNVISIIGEAHAAKTSTGTTLKVKFNPR
jgi:hypothetical protein